MSIQAISAQIESGARFSDDELFSLLTQWARSMETSTWGPHDTRDKVLSTRAAGKAAHQLIGR